MEDNSKEEKSPKYELLFAEEKPNVLTVKVEEEQVDAILENISFSSVRPVESAENKRTFSDENKPQLTRKSDHVIQSEQQGEEKSLKFFFKEETFDSDVKEVEPKVFPINFKFTTLKTETQVQNERLKIDEGFTDTGEKAKGATYAASMDAVEEQEDSESMEIVEDRASNESEDTDAFQRSVSQDYASPTDLGKSVGRQKISHQPAKGSSAFEDLSHECNGNVLCKEFSEGSVVKAHELTTADSRQYSCNLRNKRCPYPLSHHQKTHFKSKKKNTQDKESFRNKLKLNVNKFKHAKLQGSVYVRKTCRGFPLKKHFILHLKKRVPVRKKSFSCEVCNKNFTRHANLNLHKMSHSERQVNKPYVCGTCGRDFGMEVHLRQHLKKHASEKSFTSETFDKDIRRRANLNNDKEPHLEKKHESNRSFPTNPGSNGNKVQLAELEGGVSCEVSTVKQKVPEGRSKCLPSAFNTNGKEFPLNSKLNRHLNIHSKKKPFRCEVCNRGFTRKDTLYTHKRIHSDLRPFKCEVCGKAFKLRSILKRHKSTHSGVLKSFKSFPNVEDLENYIDKRTNSYNELSSENSGLDVRNLAPSHSESYPRDSSYKRYSDPLSSTNHLEPHVKEKENINESNRSFPTNPGSNGNKVQLAELEGGVSCEVSTVKQKVPEGRSKCGPFVCKTCGKEFPLNSKLNRHLKVHLKKKPFRCEVCGRGFARKDTLDTHKRIHSDLRPFKCEVCGKAFKLRSTLKKHKSTHSGGIKYFNCNVCGRRFHKKSKLDSHKVTHMGKEPFACRVCNKGFTTKHERDLHSRNHSEIRPFLCELCGNRFYSMVHLEKHILIHKGLKPFSCDFCHKSFYLQADKMMHEKNKHTEFKVKQFSCDVCNRRFATKESIVYHIKRHLKSFSCDLCGKAFFSKNQLSKHKMVHVGYKAFSCDECDKCFLTKVYLQRHILVHSELKPFSCDVCGKAFKRRTFLTRHKVIHSESKKLNKTKAFKCDVCGKRFGYYHSFNDHKKSHSGIKPFPCDVCGKCFPSKVVLNTHKKSHSEKKFSCDICGRAFTHKHHLDVHKMAHLGVKPFSCDQCSKSFTRKQQLNAHKMTHLDKPFSCDLCNLGFKQKKHLVLHIKAHLSHVKKKVNKHV